jgi:tRNA isopentenyl-2-thiomethyl-A-37 hydroxylase MiaE
MFRKYGINIPTELYDYLQAQITDGMFKHITDAILSLSRDLIRQTDVDIPHVIQVKEVFKDQKHKIQYVNLPPQMYSKLNQLIPEEEKQKGHLVIGDLIVYAIYLPFVAKL